MNHKTLGSSPRVKAIMAMPAAPVMATPIHSNLRTTFTLRVFSRFVGGSQAARIYGEGAAITEHKASSTTVKRLFPLLIEMVNKPMVKPSNRLSAAALEP